MPKIQDKREKGEKKSEEKNDGEIDEIPACLF